MELLFKLKKFTASLITLTILFSFCSCVQYEAKKIEQSALITRFNQRSLNDRGLLTFLGKNSLQTDYRKKSVWGLNDLTLVAFYFHPELDVARAGWEVEQSVEETSKEFNAPNLSLTPGFNSSNTMASPWILTSLIQFTYETAGKHDIRIDFAHKLTETARLHIAEVAWQVRNRVRREMANVYIAAKKETILGTQLKLQKENMVYINRLFNEKKVSTHEILQFQILINQTQLALNDVHINAIKAKLNLASALGLSGKALENIRLTFNELFDSSLKNSKEEKEKALLNRADILKGLTEYAATEDSLRMAIAKQYPDIQLGPGYQYDQGENKWSLSLDATTPLFSRNKGDIHEAERRRSQAAAKFNALQIKVLQKIEQTEIIYNETLKKMAIAEELQKNCQLRLNEVRILHNDGKIPVKDLFFVQKEFYNAEMVSVNVLSETQHSLCDLENAIQWPLSFNEDSFQLPARETSHLK